MTTKQERFNIVVGYDFTDSAAEALRMGVGVATSRPCAALHLAAVLDDKRGLARVWPNEGADYPLAEKVRTELQQVVASSVGADHEGDLRVFAHARMGDAADELLRLAEEAGADMIVVGTRGLSGPKRWMLGSVAERIVRHARCPVLIARPSGYGHAELADFQPEPPCPACVARRRETENAQWWCEEHSGQYLAPHRYAIHRGELVAKKTTGSILW